MAKKNMTTVTDEEHKTVEEWKKFFGTSDAVFAGASVKQGWNKGRQITGKEYTGAVESFLKSTIGGKR